MYFKIHYSHLLTAVLLVFSISCTYEQKPALETKSDESTPLVEEVIIDQSHSTEQLALYEKVKNANISDFNSLYTKIKTRVYANYSVQKYLSKSYTTDVNILVVFYQKVKDLDEKMKMKVLEEFDVFFLQSCLSSQPQCYKLKKVLQKVANSIVLIHDIAQNKQGKERLMYVGLGYEVKSSRHFKNLDRLYTLTVIDLIQDGVSLSKQHTTNVLNILKKSDVEDIDLSLIEKIKPWKYSVTDTDAINLFRSTTVNYIFEAASNSKKIQQLLAEENKRLLENNTKNSTALSDYPAYNDINVKTTLDGNILSSFIALKLFFQEMSQQELSTLINNYENKQEILFDSFTKIRTLIKWKIAQLSINSTKTITQTLTEDNVLKKKFMQNTINLGKLMVPDWNKLHSEIVFTTKSFFQANLQYLDASQTRKIDQFYSSIDKNILKTVVYPNMFGLAYHMSKTEWSDVLKILWWEIQIDSKSIYDNMFSGYFFQPWFNFINISKGTNFNQNSKTALMRPEIIDALYYFFATKTHKLYKVSADDFINEMSTKLTDGLKNKIGDLLSIQKKIYFTQTSNMSQFLNWCRNIENGIISSETIPFRNFSEYNTPYKLTLRSSDYKEFATIYYKDLYSLENGISSLRVDEAIDRVRLELTPINDLNILTLNFVERLRNNYSNVIDSPLVKSKKSINNLSTFLRRFWSVQFAIRDHVGDCDMTAAKESRRRSALTTIADNQYFEKVVHPLSMAILDKKITIDEANEELKKVHDTNSDFIDNFIQGSSNEVIFNTNKYGFLLRARLYLTKGIHYSSNVVSDFSINPIVGKHLNIPLNGDNTSLSRSRNKYIKKEFNTSSYINKTISAKDFSRDLSAQIGVNRSFAGQVYRAYQNWETKDASTYIRALAKRVEFLVQAYKLGPLEVINYEKTDCKKHLFNSQNIIDDSCLTKVEYTINDIAQAQGLLFESFEIKGYLKDYFDLTKMQSFMNLRNQDSIVEIYQTSANISNAYYRSYKQVRGFFDLAYEYMNSSYLGRATEDPDPLNACISLRDSCPWHSNEDLAYELFLARNKRTGLIFNFDRKILDEQYKNIASKIKRSKQGLQRIHDVGEEVMLEVRNGQSSYLFDNFAGPVKLQSLTVSKQNLEFEIERFFNETTEGFFFDQPSWNNYLLN